MSTIVNIIDARLKYARMRLDAWENGFVPSEELLPMWEEYRRSFRKLIKVLEKQRRDQHEPQTDLR